MQQFVVDADADPGVGCGVDALLVGERRGFPVAQALGLGDPLSEDDGREFAQALLLDAPLRGDGLQVDEPLVAEVADLAQRAQVAGDVGADLQHPGVFEQLQDGLRKGDLVEPEEVADLRCGELEQRDAERHARAERGACLGVEPDDGLLGETLAGRGDVALVVDDADFAPEFDGRELSGLLVADFVYE